MLACRPACEPPGWLQLGQSRLYVPICKRLFCKKPPGCSYRRAARRLRRRRLRPVPRGRTDVRRRVVEHVVSHRRSTPDPTRLPIPPPKLPLTRAWPRGARQKLASSPLEAHILMRLALPLAANRVLLLQIDLLRRESSYGAVNRAAVTLRHENDAAGG